MVQSYNLGDNLKHDGKWSTLIQNPIRNLSVLSFMKCFESLKYLTDTKKKLSVSA